MMSLAARAWAISHSVSPRRLTAWVTKGSLAIADQGLFAGSNFLLNVLLARWLEPADYGAFALAYSVFLLLGVFHTALLTEPMLVFGPGRYRERFPEYLGILLRGHLALMLPGMLLLVIVGALVGRFHSASIGHAFLGLAVAAPLILLLWLLRRAFYVRLQPFWAAVGGLLYFILLSSFLFVLWAGKQLSPGTAFLGMGLGALVVCVLLLFRLQPRRVAIGGVASFLFLLALIYGLWLSRGPLAVTAFTGMGVAALVVSAFMLLRLGPRWTASESNPTVAMVTADHWRYGRWSVATAGASWLPSNIYYVLLPAWMSMEGAAALRALMNFAMPVLHSMAALSMILLPSLVRARKSHGDRGMHKTMYSFFALYAFGCATYLALLVALGPRLFRLLYAGKYSEYAFLPLLLVGLVPFGSMLYSVMGSGLRALEQPKWIFWSYVGSSLVALVVGIPLVTLLGVSGALIGLLFSSLATGVLMFWFYRRSAREQPVPGSEEPLPSKA